MCNSDSHQLVYWSHEHIVHVGMQCLFRDCCLRQWDGIVSHLCLYLLQMHVNSVDALRTRSTSVTGSVESYAMLAYMYIHMYLRSCCVRIGMAFHTSVSLRFFRCIQHVQRWEHQLVWLEPEQRRWLGLDVDDWQPWGSDRRARSRPHI